jgi:transcriptional regulator with XRE-family HTH domain
MNKKIGPMIRNARTHKGLSQAELATKVGVSQAAIGHWERGTFTPKGKNLNALSEILGIALQPDLPEVEAPDEGKIAIGKNFRRDPLARNVPWRASATDHRSQAAEFEGWLENYLDGFDATVKLNAPDGDPEHEAWKIDFMSDRTIVEVRHLISYQRIGETIERALWRLAFLQAVYGDEMMYVAVIRRPTAPTSLANIPPAYERLVTRLCAEADLVGIHLFLVDTPEEAALAILGLEGRAPQSTE